jgi:hypothetical protein
VAVRGRAKAAWQEITSAGLGQARDARPESRSATATCFVVNDLIDAIETGPPARSCSRADGRAALEMVLAVYESHRLEHARRPAAQDPRTTRWR